MISSIYVWQNAVTTSATFVFYKRKFVFEKESGLLLIVDFWGMSFGMGWEIFSHFHSYEVFNKTSCLLLHKSITDPFTRGFLCPNSDWIIDFRPIYGQYAMKNFPTPAVDQMFCLIQNKHPDSIWELIDVWLNFSFVFWVFGTKHTQSLEITEGTHSPGILCNLSYNVVFLFRKKVPLSLESGSSMEICHNWERGCLGGCFDLWGSRDPSGAEAAPCIIRDRQAVVTPNVLSLSGLNSKGLSFTYATCPTWPAVAAAGDGGGVWVFLLSSRSETPAEGVSMSACISAFASQGRAELVGLLLAFCKISVGRILTISQNYHMDTPSYKQSRKHSPRGCPRRRMEPNINKQ